MRFFQKAFRARHGTSHVRLKFLIFFIYVLYYFFDRLENWICYTKYSKIFLWRK